MDRGAKCIILIPLLFVLLAGCSLFGSGVKESEKSPQELMDEGLSQFRDGNYEKATESFQKLKDRYPYSKLAIQAEIKLADTFFKGGEYEDALGAYREFERLHPKNPSIPYVIFQQAMCHFLRMNTIDRDQTPAKDSLREFERLRREFPRSQFSLRAQRYIRVCLRHLASHEFYVGHHYFKSGHYAAALGRFKYLMRHYPDLGHYGQTLLYIAKCREKLSEQKSLQ